MRSGQLFGTLSQRLVGRQQADIRPRGISRFGALFSDPPKLGEEFSIGHWRTMLPKRPSDWRRLARVVAGEAQHAELGQGCVGVADGVDG